MNGLRGEKNKADDENRKLKMMRDVCVYSSRFKFKQMCLIFIVDVCLGGKCRGSGRFLLLKSTTYKHFELSYL